jgi:hypothetical protein
MFFSDDRDKITHERTQALADRDRDRARKPRIRLWISPADEHHDDDDHEKQAESAHSGVPPAVSVAAEASGEAAGERDDH